MDAGCQLERDQAIYGDYSGQANRAAIAENFSSVDFKLNYKRL
ncbi:MAG: hypothetical protein AAGF98_06040 [Cyanobacteria bacterium P01_H01_bin.153]